MCHGTPAHHPNLFLRSGLADCRNLSSEAILPTVIRPRAPGPDNAPLYLAPPCRVGLGFVRNPVPVSSGNSRFGMRD